MQNNTFDGAAMLDTVTNWLRTCPGIGNLQVDYLSRSAPGAAVYPSGIEELSCSRDILGGVTVRNRVSFRLRFSMERGAASAGWLLDFQQWIQEQSLANALPRLGTRTEAAVARKGALTDADELLGLYAAELLIEYTLEG